MAHLLLTFYDSWDRFEVWAGLKRREKKERRRASREKVRRRVTIEVQLEFETLRYWWIFALLTTPKDLECDLRGMFEVRGRQSWAKDLGNCKLIREEIVRLTAPKVPKTLTATWFEGSRVESWWDTLAFMRAKWREIVDVLVLERELDCHLHLAWPWTITIDIMSTSNSTQQPQLTKEEQQKVADQAAETSQSQPK